MSARRILAVPICAAILLAPAGAAAESYSVGSQEQVAWVRRAATNFVTAELNGSGAGACAILSAPLRRTFHHRSCAQRWDVRLARLHREPASRALLRRQQHAIPSAIVVVHGENATITLPSPLMDGHSHFRWSENCWMLER